MHYTGVSNSHLINQPVTIIVCQLVVWHHVIGAKSYDLRHFSHLAQRTADKLGGSGLVIQTPGLLHVFDWPDDANSIDRSGFAAYTPLQLITGKQLAKERSDETHLSAKRTGTQTSSWIPLSDVYRWWSPGIAGTSCKGSCAPLCLDAALVTEGYLKGV